MKCPICGNEMENGRINLSSGGMSLELKWYTEEDCSHPFLKKPFLYSKYSYTFDGFTARKDFPIGYYCSYCNKIVAFLDVNT